MRSFVQRYWIPGGKSLPISRRSLRMEYRRRCRFRLYDHRTAHGIPSEPLSSAPQAQRPCCRSELTPEDSSVHAFPSDRGAGDEFQRSAGAAVTGPVIQHTGHGNGDACGILTGIVPQSDRASGRSPPSHCYPTARASCLYADSPCRCS